MIGWVAVFHAGAQIRVPAMICEYAEESGCVYAVALPYVMPDRREPTVAWSGIEAIPKALVYDEPWYVRELRCARGASPSIVRLLAEKDPSYRPYCLRCVGLVRMVKVERMFWKCTCGAVHDERASRSPP